MALADVHTSFVALVLSALVASTASAHEAGTTRAIMSINHDGTFSVVVTTDAASLLGRLEVARRQPRTTLETREELQDAFDSLCGEISRHVAVEFDGRPEILRAECRVEPAGAAQQDVVSVIGLAVRLAGTVPVDAANVRWRYDLTFASYSFGIAGRTAPDLWLEGGQQTPPLAVVRLPVPPSALRLAWQYASAGQQSVVPHGLGQILFLAGLAWLSSRLLSVLLLTGAFGVGQAVAALAYTAASFAIPASLSPYLVLSLFGIAGVAWAGETAIPWRGIIAFALGLPHGLWLGARMQAISRQPVHTGVDATAYAAGAVAAQLGLAAFLWFVAGGRTGGTCYLTSRLNQAKPSRTP